MLKRTGSSVSGAPRSGAALLRGDPLSVEVDQRIFISGVEFAEHRCKTAIDIGHEVEPFEEDHVSRTVDEVVLPGISDRGDLFAVAERRGVVEQAGNDAASRVVVIPLLPRGVAAGARSREVGLLSADRNCRQQSQHCQQNRKKYAFHRDADGMVLLRRGAIRRNWPLRALSPRTRTRTWRISAV